MIGRSDVEAAWRLIQPHVRRTPAIELPAGMFGISSTLALKLESLQVSGSFKGRGAFHKLLASKVPAAGIIAASGGNHGAAAAYAARALGHTRESDHSTGRPGQDAVLAHESSRVDEAAGRRHEFELSRAEGTAQPFHVGPQYGVEITIDDRRVAAGDDFDQRCELARRADFGKAGFAGDLLDQFFVRRISERVEETNRERFDSRAL